MATFRALAALPLALAMAPPPHVGRGHMLSGIPIGAAGVVPYVNMPGRGVHVRFFPAESFLIPLP